MTVKFYLPGLLGRISFWIKPLHFLSFIYYLKGESLDSDGCCEASGGGICEGSRHWRASANDISPHTSKELVRAPSCPGYVNLPF